MPRLVALIACGTVECMSTMPARDPLPQSEIERIRRERAQPRLWDFHYLHLKGLLDGIESVVVPTGRERGDTLDLYCGTQPYRHLLGEGPTWGVDIDLHYGSADLIADLPLPFADGSFSLVLCSQALYYRDDDEAVVSEIQRILVPGGRAVVTVPILFTRSRNGRQRRYSSRELKTRFSEWSSLELSSAGSIGTGLAYVVGRLLQAVDRRAPRARYLTRCAAVAVNVGSFVIDFLARPLTSRLPATLILVARR